MKKLLTFLMMSILAIGVGWAAETVCYTLDGDTQGGTNAYDSESDITQNGMDWKVKGNTKISPWRIGGKNLTNEERPVYSQTAMGNAISKIELEIGGITLTSVQVRLIVASDADFSSVIETIPISGNLTANRIYTFTPSTQTEWVAGSYYKFVFVVTAGSSNSYVQFQNAKFYKNESSLVSAPTFSPAGGNYDEPLDVTISCSTDGATIYYTTDGNDPTTTSSVYSTAIPVSSTTIIKAMAVKSGMTNSNVVSATYSFPATVTPPYDENFSDGFGDFYTKTVTNPGFDVWTTASYQGKTYAKAAAYKDKQNYASESWLISPYINLANTTNPELSFSQAIDNHFGSIANEATLWVKENNALTWTQITINYPDAPTSGYTDFEPQTINLGDYKNKIIQIAFKYKSTTSNAGNWEVSDIKVKDNNPSVPSYYLVGSFNDWTGSDAFKFEESNGNYVLNEINLPDDVEFKIIKVENGTTTWYGGSVNNNKPYALTSTWHTNIPMKDTPNYGESIQNFKMSVGGISNFTLNTSDMTFSVEKTTPQFYFKSSADWTLKEVMASTADGWTITKDCAAGTYFGFNDEWTWYGRDNYWITDATVGKEIDLYNDGTFYIENAGTYTFKVYNNKTKLIVTTVTGDVYTLVESADDLVNGSEYIIATLEGTTPTIVLLGAVSNNLGTTVSDNFVYNANDKTITLQSGCSASKLTLGGSAGAWTFNDGNGYLAYTKSAENSSSGNNNLFLVSDATTDGTEWVINTVEISADNNYCSNKLINNAFNTERYLQYNYNSGNDRFACYKTFGQKGISLFKKQSSTPPSNQVATPSITPGSADSSSPYIVYGGKQEITINCATSGATIYYTTDGSTPTTSSTPYAEPCYLTSTGGNVTVKAIAVKADLDDSEIATSYYLFTSPAGPTFNPVSGTVRTEAFDVIITSEYDDAEIYYMLDPASAPTATQMSTNGTIYETPVNVSGEGSHTIYAMVIRNGIKSSVVDATYTITSGGTTGDGEYVKVTSAPDLTDGEYLIVYEEGLVAFNGSLTTLDAANNTIGVEINNFTIPSTPPVDAAVFTFDATAGTFMNASGVYIGRTSDANGLESGTTALTNTVSIDDDGNAVIISSGGAYLRYNANSDQKRFRYFKSSTYEAQKPVALYKKTTAVVIEPVVLEGVAFTTDRQWATWYGDASLALPEGVTAYVVTGVQGDAVAVEALDYIPASTGVLLYSETAAESVSAMPYTGEAGTIPTNLLMGGLEAQTVSNAYLLYNNQFILAQDGTTVGAHRCYLPMSASAQGVPVLKIGTPGTVTGIETISTNGNGDNTYYNLMGQPVANPTPGIYIRGGKKVIVK